MATRALDAFKRSITGHGLVHPLRRLAGNDFVSASGESLVKASISQVLGTRRGELPWRPDFGLDVERYRHTNVTVAKEMRLSEEVAKTIARFEERAAVRQCQARKSTDSNIINVRVRWSLRSERGMPGVLLPPVTQEAVV